MQQALRIAHFAWFGTTGSKSRLNFLALLRAGYDNYVINAEALAYMRERALAGPVIARLPSQPCLKSSPPEPVRPDCHDFCPSYF